MSQLIPERLHTRFEPGIDPVTFQLPRCYTLTHSDTTGDLFLTIGNKYDIKQISGWYTRLMRDEVLAEWRTADKSPELHVFCHVSGGVVVGSAGWRFHILQTHMTQVLQAFRYGENFLMLAHPELDQASVWVHFHASQQKYRQILHYGIFGDYALALDPSIRKVTR